MSDGITAQSYSTQIVAVTTTTYLMWGGLRPDFHQRSFRRISVCVAQSLIQITQSWENFYSGRCGDNDLLLNHWPLKIPVNHSAVKGPSPSPRRLSPRLWGCWLYPQSSSDQPRSHSLSSQNHGITELLRLEKSSEIALQAPNRHRGHLHHQTMSSNATATRVLNSSRDSDSNAWTAFQGQCFSL